MVQIGCGHGTWNFSFSGYLLLTKGARSAVEGKGRGRAVWGLWSVQEKRESREGLGNCDLTAFGKGLFKLWFLSLKCYQFVWGWFFGSYVHLHKKFICSQHRHWLGWGLDFTRVLVKHTRKGKEGQERGLIYIWKPQSDRPWNLSWEKIWVMDSEKLWAQWALISLRSFQFPKVHCANSSGNYNSFLALFK